MYILQKIYNAIHYPHTIIKHTKCKRTNVRSIRGKRIYLKKM